MKKGVVTLDYGTLQTLREQFNKCVFGSPLRMSRIASCYIFLLKMVVLNPGFWYESVAFLDNLVPLIVEVYSLSCQRSQTAQHDDRQSGMEWILIEYMRQWSPDWKRSWSLPFLKSTLLMCVCDIPYSALQWHSSFIILWLCNYHVEKCTLFTIFVHLIWFNQ